MARLFAGGNGSDNQRTVNTANILNRFSYTVSVWCFRTGTDTGRIWTKGGVSTQEHNMISSGTILRFSAPRWTNNDPIWTWNTPLTLDTWQHLALTYTGDSTSTDPTLYLDGVDLGLRDSETTPQGSFNFGSTGDMTIGNQSLQNLAFHGRLCEFAYWDRILTAGEVKILAAGKCPLRVRPNRLRIYTPMYGRSPERAFGRSFSITGTTQADHAPVGPPYGFD
jgi:hypothetical protein